MRLCLRLRNRDSFHLTCLLLGFFCFQFSAQAQAQNQNYRGRVAAKPANGPVVSQNFVVYAPDPILARKVSSEAERFRKELAVEWLGQELPSWPQKCPITVELKIHAGGETSFAFEMDGSGRGTPLDWKMKIFGPVDRVLDAVLPHEITHTIFATHFGCPLPRWADEGACTTVEHESERKKNHHMLLDFLTSSPSRGLPFNRMFTMRNYPHDILPLYAQGYSVAKFLILQKGKRHFLDYIGQGLQNESRGEPLEAWNRATDEFYKYDDLSDLQVAWLDWVQNGSDEAVFQKPGVPFTYASAETNREDETANFTSPSDRGPETQTRVASRAKEFANGSSESWYVQQMNQSPTHTRKFTPLTDTLLEVQDSSLPSEFRASPNTLWR